MKVSVGVSNRHVHLCLKDFQVLFGKDCEFLAVKDLKQYGEFASNCFLTLQTEKDSISNVRVLGPHRRYTQVEISKTDAYKLGLNPPVRDSGDLEGSSPITLIGPMGSLKLSQGCILASRHIHLTKEQKHEFGFDDKEEIAVRVSGEKSGILGNIRLKIVENGNFELHLDTDDANAFLLRQDDWVEIIDEYN